MLADFCTYISLPSCTVSLFSILPPPEPQIFSKSVDNHFKVGVRETMVTKGKTLVTEGKIRLKRKEVGRSLTSCPQGLELRGQIGPFNFSINIFCEITHCRKMGKIRTTLNMSISES